MRPLISFLLLTLLSSKLHSQITLTKADMPIAGDSIYLSLPDSLAEIDLSDTGPNSSWDFSYLEAAFQQREVFLSPSQSPFSLQIFFLGATIVREISSPDSIAGIALGEGFEYFNSGNSAYEGMGWGGSVNGIPVPLVNNPKDQVYSFPLTYGDDTISTSFVAELAVPGLNVYLRQERSRTNIVDGWGSLSTPYGLFDALRLTSTIVGRDSFALDTVGFAANIPTSRQYKWLTNGKGIPVFQVNTIEIDSIGEVQTSIRYQDSARDVPLLGIATSLETKALQLFPNPASKTVSIEGNFTPGKIYSLQIFSADGKLISKMDMKTGFETLELTSLPIGSYLVRVLGEDRQYTGRLIIRR